jgi:hypothetical protein
MWTTHADVPILDRRLPDAPWRPSFVREAKPPPSPERSLKAAERAFAADDNDRRGSASTEKEGVADRKSGGA